VPQDLPNPFRDRRKPLKRAPRIAPKSDALGPLHSPAPPPYAPRAHQRLRPFSCHWMSSPPSPPRRLRNTCRTSLPTRRALLLNSPGVRPTAASSQDRPAHWGVFSEDTPRQRQAWWQQRPTSATTSFQAGAPGTTWWISLGGGTPQRLDRLGGIDGFLQMSPDGESVAFETRDRGETELGDVPSAVETRRRLSDAVSHGSSVSAARF
jgi:hypothetical protein